MSNKDEALKLAMEALESCDAAHITDGGRQWYDEKLVDRAITALQVVRKLADQPAQQEPVAQRFRVLGVDGREYWTNDRPMSNCTILEVQDLFISPQPVQQQEPTKAMIDAAERIDWSDSDVRGNIVNMWQAMCAAAPQPAVQQGPYTYTSTQATNCAGCGEHKHTPLRIDKMGGYVCLTCIDKKLGSLLGEFGYPLPVQGWKPSEANYKEWWDRHGLHGPTARAAFEDAASLYLTAAPQPAQQQEPVAWRWSESNGQRFFDWTTDWSHHDKAKSMGFPIEYAYASPQPAQQQQEPVPAAMKTVIEAMQADPDYAWSWHCNVAMAFVDAGGDHYTGNQGAARFMKMLANVEPAYELPSPQPAQQQEPVALPCCGYTDASAVKWNHYNQVVQCHNCGQIYHAHQPAQQEQQPVWRTGGGIPRFKQSEQRPWVDLTDEEISGLFGRFVSMTGYGWRDLYRMAEAKLKEKNNG